MLLALIIYVIVVLIIIAAVANKVYYETDEGNAAASAALLAAAIFTVIGVGAGWVWTDSENRQNQSAWEFHSIVAEDGDVSDVAANDRYQYLNQTRAEDFLHGLSLSDEEGEMLSGELREHRAWLLMRDLSDGDDEIYEYDDEAEPTPLRNDMQALALKAVTVRYTDKGNCFYRATLQTLTEWHEQKTKKESWLIEETQDTLIANDPDLVDCVHTFERYETETN